MIRGQRSRMGGVTMIEVLITIVILTVGLLGVAGLQARMQLAEVESYHRSHAIVLLQDIVDRVAANRRDAMNYVCGAELYRPHRLCLRSVRVEQRAARGVGNQLGRPAGRRHDRRTRLHQQRQRDDAARIHGGRRVARREPDCVTDGNDVRAGALR